MRNLLQSIADIGIKAQYDDFTKERIKIFNLDLLLGAFIILLIEVIYFFAKPEGVAFVHILLFASLFVNVISIYLNSKFYHNLAITVISVFTAGLITLMAAYYGKESQIHLMLPILAVTPITHLFNNLRLGIALSLLFAISFFYLLFIDFNLLPITNQIPETANLIRKITEALLFPIFAYRMLLIFKSYWDGIHFTKSIIKEKDKSQELYKVIFENALSGIIVFDLKSLRPIAANPNALDLFKWKEEQLEAIQIIDYLPPQQSNQQDSYMQWLKIVNKILDQSFAHYEFSFQDASGRIFHTDLSATQLPSPDNHIAVLTVRDITEKKNSDELLRSSEDLFRQLYENSPLGVVLETNQNRELIKFNPTFRRMLGYHSDEELSQITVDQITHPDDLNIHEENYRLLSIGAIDSFNIEKRYLKKDGSILYGNVYLSSIINDQGEFYDIAMIEDITEKKQSELLIKQKIKELNEKNEELQRYAQSNSELENFAYVASHDLREPLRTISGFSQLLGKRYTDLLDDDGKDYLNFIITATSYMETLVNDLLTYSRVNTQNYMEEEINLKELLEVVAFSLHQSIKDNQGKIKFENIPDIIYGDRSRLKQLFQNLIANAIKFKKPDTAPVIVVSCEEMKNHWQFRVSDNGIGIQEVYHEKIFQLFRKLHRKDEYDGSGIGLALCKKVIEQHGGNIWVESEFGESTCFYFNIPKGKIKEVKMMHPERKAIY